MLCNRSYPGVDLNYYKSRYLFNIILYIMIPCYCSVAQSHSDSLVKQTNFLCSSSIYLIEGWQNISNRTNLLNCQFENCCSKYSVNAFQDNGFMIGCFRTTNRLIRCNPLARFCYSRNSDGFLIDDSDSIKYLITKKQKESAFLNGIIYSLSIVPGLHKLLLGKWSDAVFTSGIIVLGFYTGKKRLKENSALHGSFTLSITTLIYLSDVHWSVDKIINSQRYASK